MVSHASHPKGRSPAFPNFGVPLYLCLNPLTQNDHVWQGNTRGEWLVFRSATPSILRQRTPILGLSPTCAYTRSDLERPNSAWYNTYGEWHILQGTTPLHIAQMRRAICQRLLSFLFTFTIVTQLTYILMCDDTLYCVYDCTA